MLRHFTRTLFLLFIFLTTFCYAEDERDNESVSSIATSEGLPSSLVNQAVCAITGDYIDTSVDVSLPGPETMFISRTYCSNPGNTCERFGMGWGANQRDCVISSSRTEGHDSIWSYDVIDSSGGRLRYETPYSYKSFHDKVIEVPLAHTKGLTNGASGEISGRTNLKNQKVIYDDHNNKVFCTNGAGNLRTFKTVKHQSKNHYFQEFEVKVNGSLYQFNHDETKEFGLSKNIRCLNSSSHKLYSEVEWDETVGKNRDFSNVLKTSDKREIKYNYYNYRGTELYLTQVTCDHKPMERYRYAKRSVGGGYSLVEKILPNHRFLKIDYYRAETNLLGEYHAKFNINDKKDYRVNRVRSLRAPVGTDSRSIATHYFLYDIKTEKDRYGNIKCLDGVTHVYDSFNHRTSYYFNKHHRLKCISKYKGKENEKHHTYSREKYVWGTEKSKNEGNLIARYLEDAKGAIHHYRHYTYDDGGNVLVSKLYGPLTGKAVDPILLDDRQRIVEGNHECEIKRCTYSDDGLNLLKSETCHGKTILYDYLPGTDLVSAKYLNYDNRIQIREFYHYNEDRMVREKIVDDGSGLHDNDLTDVTERQITRYSRSKTAPVGLPLIQTNLCLDLKTGQERVINKIVSEFDNLAQLKKEEHFDAKGRYRYSKKWDYDAHGNVIAEQNPLKETISKKYDANDNLIEQSGPHPDFSMRLSYDYMNRLLSQKETHGEGKTYSTKHTYNYLGQCTTTVDPYGNETRFKYDDLGRVIATYLPEVADENGIPVKPVTRKVYNIADFPVKLIDALGRETTIDYNCRGKPTKIIYPDETEERFIYYLNGELAVKIAKNGTRTQYVYDPQGRVLTEIIKASTGAVLSTQQWTYNAFHLLSHTDPEGLTTTYGYDEAGRLVKMTKEQQLQEYSYDSLGRRICLKEWDGPKSYRLFLTKYDYLDRKTAESACTPDGTILYSASYQYDCNGNQILVCNGENCTRTEYDLDHNPIKIVNANGDATYTVYDNNYVNEHGKKVLKSETTDPLGNITIHIFDTANRLVEVAKKNSLGEKTFSQKIYYDLAGNKTRVVDNVLFNDELLRSTENIFLYTKENQLERIIEAAGTANQKVTQYFHNHLGQKISTIKPDGVAIDNTYDSKGRLKSVSSSDGTIRYEYSYNANDQVVKAEDKLHGIHTERIYNKLGELIEEKLGHGQTMKYSFDRAGQLCKIELPDQTAFEYTYHAVNLAEIHRIKKGKRVYSHYDQTHNLVGHTTSAKLPGNNGEISYRYDPMERFRAISHPSLNQQVPAGGYDSCGNLLHYQSQGKDYHFSYDDLYQLTSEKGHTYQSDSVSNRLQKDQLSHTINELNQLVKRGKETFEYDPNGNLIKRVKQGITTHYSYDALDRLTSIVIAGEEINYRYDAFNRRLIKQISHRPDQHFLYAAQEEIGLLEKGVIKQLKMISKGKRSPAVAIELGNKTYVPLYDLFGNIVCMNTLEGKPVERYTYTAFGEVEITDGAGNPLTESAIGNPWQYANRRYDAETGFIAFGLRYYEPDLARWLTPDPAGFEDGPNLYAYVHNSPLILFDQYGLFGECGIPIVSWIFNLFNYFACNMAQAMPIHRNYSDKSRGGNLAEDPVKYCGASGNYLVDQVQDPKTGEISHLDTIPNGAIGFTNGIQNNFEDFGESLSHVAQLSGTSVLGVFDLIQGVLRDLQHHGEALFGGIAYTPIADLHHQWNEFFNNNPEDAIFLQICHSRGAVNVRNALMSYPPELRKRIRVIAVAPAAFIDPSICESVVHLVSVRDFVPFNDLYNMIRFRETVVFLMPAKGASVHDHSFTSPTFAPEIFGLINDYRNEMKALEKKRVK